jgi:RNA polymerase sigma-70 factor (ECF subfamily)
LEEAFVMEESRMVAPHYPPMEEQADSIARLAHKAKGGDRNAYGELVRRFQGGIHAVLVSWLHDPSEADDVAQDVFLHGMRKLSQLRDVRCFAGWLRQIAVRLALNRLSRRRPAGGGMAHLMNLPARDEGPLTDLVRAETCIRVRESLGHLRPLDREVLEAFYLEGRSLQEISSDLDAPLGTVKRRLHTARQRLRDYLEASPGLNPCPA